MSYITIYDGKPLHECDALPPAKDYNPGAIIKCDGCYRMHRLNEVQGIYMWQRYTQPRNDPY